MRRWQLKHPGFGRLEVLEGSVAEMRQVDPNWDKPDGADGEERAVEDPGGPHPSQAVEHSCRSSEADGQGGSDAASADESDETSDDAGNLRDKAEILRGLARRLPGPLRAAAPRLEALADRAQANFGNYVVILRDGLVLIRFARAGNGSFALGGADEEPVPADAGAVTRIASAADKPYLRFEASGVGEVLNVYYVGRDGTVAFPHPEGSYAQQRARAMERSPVKRLLYPVLAGLGRVGGAVTVLVVAPILGAVLAPIREPVKAFFKAVGEAISGFLGVILAPIRRLLAALLAPIVELVDRLLAPIGRFLAWLLTPLRRLLGWLRSLMPDLPDWLEWLIDHPKLWLPVMVGLGMGVGAYLRNRRARRTRPEWAGERPEPDDDQDGETHPESP